MSGGPIVICPTKHIAPCAHARGRGCVLADRIQLENARGLAAQDQYGTILFNRFT